MKALSFKRISIALLFLSMMVVGIFGLKNRQVILDYKLKQPDYVLARYNKALSNHDFAKLRRYVGPEYLHMLDIKHESLLYYMGFGKQIRFEITRIEYSNGGMRVKYGMECVYQKFCTFEMIILEADSETKKFKVVTHHIRAYQPQDMKKEMEEELCL